MIEKMITPYCYKIMPLVYDDSLSYYEFLCKILKKLNETIEELNKLRNEFDEFKAYVEGEIARILALIDELREDLENFRTYVEGKISDIESELERHEGLITDCQDDISSIEDDIETRINPKLDEHDDEIATLTDRVNSLFSQLNGIFGALTYIQNEIDNLILVEDYDSATEELNLSIGVDANANQNESEEL